MTISSFTDDRKLELSISHLHHTDTPCNGSVHKADKTKIWSKQRQHRLLGELSGIRPLTGFDELGNKYSKY